MNNNFKKKIQTHWQVNFLIFLTSLCLTSAVISYPLICIILFFYIFALWFFLPKRSMVVSYAAGVIAGSSWFVPLLISAGLENLLKNSHFLRSMGAQLNGFKKIFIFIAKYGTASNLILIFLLASAFILFLTIMTRKKYQFLNSLTIFISLLFFFSISVFLGECRGCVFFLSAIGLIITPLAFLFNYDREPLLVKQLFILVWIPSVLAGLIFTWCSSNSVYVNVIGTFPGVLIGMFLITKSIPDSVNKNAFFTLIILFIFIASLNYFNLSYIYQDYSINYLDTKISSGPFKGLYTTRVAKDFYVQLNQDIKQIYKSGNHILFYDNFPAGYLFSDMRPATNNIWLFSSGSFPNVDRQSTIDYLNKQHLLPDLIVKVIKVPYTDHNTTFKKNKPDPIEQLTKTYQLILRRDEYEIYKRNWK